MIPPTCSEYVNMWHAHMLQQARFTRSRHFPDGCEAVEEVSHMEGGRSEIASGVTVYV